MDGVPFATAASCSRSIAGAARGEPGLREIAVAIPAWQPDERLTSLVASLRREGFTRLLVVDDGSTAACLSRFRELESTYGVVLCRHEQNRGKGQALKTAFRHVLARMPDVKGVVTADADGQHLPEDIVRVARQLARDPERAVLGVRSFDGQVPLRSRVGNALTRQLFASVTGHKVRDTQTGLRGLPRQVVSEVVDLAGERYEYEMVMLAHLCQGSCGPTEVAIQTVYLEKNRGSHFHPLRDSLQVYRALFQACARGPRSGSYRVRTPDKPRFSAA